MKAFNVVYNYLACGVMIGFASASPPKGLLVIISGVAGYFLGMAILATIKYIKA